MLVGCGVVFFVDVFLIDVAGEVVVFVECLCLLEVSPCYAYAGAVGALAEIGGLVNRLMIVCLDGSLCFCSVVEGTP